MDSNSEAGTTLMVGIDFGTTHSGVAWKFSMDEGVPDLVTSWSSTLSHNSETPKVPSTIYYDQDGSGSISWGHGIPASARPIKWFKLLLLDDADLQKYIKWSSHVEETKAAIRKLNKDAIEVTADFLRQLWGHSLEMIKEAKGDALVNSTPIRVVVTVPAIWTDYARDRMRKAVDLAGICAPRLCGKTKLSLISEPEAAALSTLREFNTFVVCDCGGGTAVEETQPFAVSEAVEGNGALCGATFVDQEFESLVKNQVGARIWRSIPLHQSKKVMNDDWEHNIKKTSDINKTWTIDLLIRLKRCTVTITPEQMQAVFRTTVSQIETLIDNQIEAVDQKTGQRPKVLILVGGFSQCRFISNPLRQRYGDDIVVLQQRGERPWAAVCRGAVVLASLGHGLLNGRIEVRSRVARMSYGWTYSAFPFDKDVHDERDKAWDEFEQGFGAIRQMHWVIKRGQEIRLSSSGTSPWCTNFALEGTGIGSLVFGIHTHHSSEPPKRRDPSIRHLLNIEYDTPVPLEELRLVSKAVNGKCVRYRRFDYEIHFEISGASVDLSVVSDGRTLATKYLSLKSG
ncbi:hypothetical protein DL768_004462 [Monosporascus sp. mg162]|nr:hypothetical protein DL768_004462 [Monosporascus sp. mg162]